MSRYPTPGFWNGRRVLLTGHTGFKGAWLAYWLHRLGARVEGVSLPPETNPNLFELARIEGLIAAHHVCDIRQAGDIARVVRGARPEVVLHLAAQSLVRPGYKAPLETIETNVQGTANVLDALRSLDTVRVAVIVTTDKVYQNHEAYYPFRETDALGGHDPYSASKAAAEIVCSCYRDSFLKEQGIGVGSARAGNVIGGGDWALDRLIPDAIRAWSSGQPLEVRRPGAIRPWQHVLEPLAGYLRLAEALWERPDLAGAYNFGPMPLEAATVREVIDAARGVFGTGETHWGEGDEGPHEAAWLALEIAKAGSLLGVAPRWALPVAVERSIRWYRAELDGSDARELCAADIDAFEAQGNQVP